MYSEQHWKIFAGHLYHAFIRLGFEVLEKPYYDGALDGFRATYIRRYLYHNQTIDGSMSSIIHLIGLPFGNLYQRMVVLASPRTVDNEPVCNTLKLRIYINENGSFKIIQSDQSTNININVKGNKSNTNNKTKSPSEDSNSKLTTFVNQMDTDQPYYHQSLINYWNENEVDRETSGQQLTRNLFDYVSHIIEMISPGLIELPTDVKLEILKRLSVASVIRMSQVNNEFKSLIIQHGEFLWRHLCMRDFNIRVINRRKHRTWMDLYKDAYLTQQIEICRKERALPGIPDRPALPPVPNLLQIEWLPEVLHNAFLPLEVDDVMQPMVLALELPPLFRAGSLHDLMAD